MRAYHVADHHVPTLPMMLDLAVFGKRFMDEDPGRILAIHCHGGKGRTGAQRGRACVRARLGAAAGTMLCAVLLYTGVAKSASDALELFALKRTNRNIVGKVQGVETPSQVWADVGGGEQGSQSMSMANV